MEEKYLDENFSYNGEEMGKGLVVITSIYEHRVPKHKAVDMCFPGLIVPNFTNKNLIGPKNIFLTDWGYKVIYKLNGVYYIEFIHFDNPITRDIIKPGEIIGTSRKWWPGYHKVQGGGPHIHVGVYRMEDGIKKYVNPYVFIIRSLLRMGYDIYNKFEPYKKQYDDILNKLIQQNRYGKK